MMAKVFSDYHPNSKQFLKIAVWTFSISLPAVTGFFRVRAGKHFPSDVIMGYALGAVSGWIIPHLHKKDLMSNGNYSILLGTVGNGFGMSLRF